MIFTQIYLNNRTLRGTARTVQYDLRNSCNEMIISPFTRVQEMEPHQRIQVCVRRKIPLLSEVLLSISVNTCPVGRGCRIHRLHLCQEVRLPRRVSCNDSKQFDGEVTVMLEVCGMQSTPLYPSLPGQLRPGVVALYRVLSMG